MSLIPVSRRPGTLLADIEDMWNAAAAPLTAWAPAFGTHLIRVEDAIEDGHYVVRAEIPGIDPVKDVEVSVRDRYLTIKAERTEKKEEKGRSEFRYGSFERTITLPRGASEEGIDARYAKGILTVSVPMKEQPKDLTRKVEVKSGD
ncbi:Hsp20/alpha crystallin family protein [Nocardia pseudobrasiliensis]|uniref:Hsp20/alpha crystallin family protein n=1 Tax=Nocardia pseudobrasiliensis TaxID=45979 RepID=A0A370HPP7_9NOCA|nr:Hsp20/alpha crystallin family protein [Nocardia pseudobrasiliensis]RDI60437.1 Hsp20/alpha crystallin family protein [Nocardia pseudobrasiliensis]